MDIVERLREGKSAGGYWREKEAADEIERLREELEDMHRRERSTAIQQLGNEGQWCDLVAAKDDEIERLREALREIVEAWDFWQSQETRCGFSELFANICEARAALKEDE